MCKRDEVVIASSEGLLRRESAKGIIDRPPHSFRGARGEWLHRREVPGNGLEGKIEEVAFAECEGACWIDRTTHLRCHKEYEHGIRIDLDSRSFGSGVRGHGIRWGDCNDAEWNVKSERFDIEEKLKIWARWLPLCANRTRMRVKSYESQNRAPDKEQADGTDD